MLKLADLLSETIEKTTPQQKQQGNKKATTILIVAFFIKILNSLNYGLGLIYLSVSLNPLLEKS